MKDYESEKKTNDLWDKVQAYSCIKWSWNFYIENNQFNFGEYNAYE